MRGRAFHHDPRELILMAAERSGLLQAVSEMMFFLSKHAPQHQGCPQCLLLEGLIDALGEVCCPSPEDLYVGYEGFGPPYLVDGETMEDLKAYLKQFPLPASSGQWDEPQKGEVQ